MKASFPPHPHQHLLFCFLDDSHSDWDEVDCQSSFELHFPWWLRMKNILSWVYWPLYFFIWEVSAWFICLFIDWLICYFDALSEILYLSSWLVFQRYIYLSRSRPAQPKPLSLLYLRLSPKIPSPNLKSRLPFPITDPLPNDFLQWAIHFSI
jgi:hypothetical protein